MIALTILLIFYGAAYFVEAKHDRLISSFGQTPEQNKEWHDLDWRYLALLGIGSGLATAGFHFNMTLPEFWWRLLEAFNTSLAIGSLKPLIFNVRINKLFGNDWNYVSSRGFEGKFKGKETLYYIICATIVVINIITIACINVDFLQ